MTILEENILNPLMETNPSTYKIILLLSINNIFGM